LSNYFTNTNRNTLTTLTLTDPNDAFESFCVPVYCDFIRNYFETYIGTLVTSLLECGHRH